MLTVHYLENSRAHRVLWLLEELDVPYGIEVYRRDRWMGAPDSLRKVHPLGKSPVIDDDGTIVAESGAIFDYLLGKYDTNGTLLPPGAPEQLRHNYWLHYAEGSLMPILVMKLVFETIPTKTPCLVRPLAGLISNRVIGKLIDPQLDRHFRFLEAELGRDGWFAGVRFSAADIMMSFAVEAGAGRVEFADARHLRSYLVAIRARPAYQQALTRGGAYAFAGTGF